VSPGTLIAHYRATPFERAWKEYVDGLPHKKKERRFLMNCARALQECSGDSPASAINDAISEAEKKCSMQPSRQVIRKYIAPVVNVLSDFDAIICTLGGFLILRNLTPGFYLWP